MNYLSASTPSAPPQPSHFNGFFIDPGHCTSHLECRITVMAAFDWHRYLIFNLPITNVLKSLEKVENVNMLNFTYFVEISLLSLRPRALSPFWVSIITSHLAFKCLWCLLKFYCACDPCEWPFFSSFLHTTLDTDNFGNSICSRLNRNTCDPSSWEVGVL